MSLTSNGFYSSVPLPLGTSINIRLLEISATLGDYGQWDDPIHCKLHLASLTDPNVRYTALSYMWGTEAASKTITVNGTEVFGPIESLGVPAPKTTRSTSNSLRQAGSIMDRRAFN